MSRTYRTPPILAFPRSEWDGGRARGPDNKWLDRDVLDGDAPRRRVWISRDRADCRIDRDDERGGMTMGRALRQVAKTRIQQGLDDWIDEIQHQIDEELAKYDDEQEYLAYMDDMHMDDWWDSQTDDWYLDDAVRRLNHEMDVLDQQSADYPA